ncbi:MAG: chorismate synthase [Actinomycetota bacterium]|nr:chorismate synthase [Actinomycetota bacterium]MDA3013707.1 chorismate synthase [Actinomycetota bacterium]
MRIRYITAGESHGPELTAIIEGLPSNFSVTKDFIDKVLSRRQKTLGSGGRMNIEKDQVYITSGVVNNLTTGGPISIKIKNLDWKNWKDREIEPFVIPRPGHADLVGTYKYSHKDIRITLERASARETAIRCAVGAIATQILNQLDINIIGYVSAIGNQELQKLDISNISDIINKIEDSEVSCPDEQTSELMKKEILSARKNKDTLGGAITCIAINFPPACGSFIQYDRKLDAQLAFSIMSVQSVKAVEIGNGVAASKQRGTEVQDQIILENKQIGRLTNNLGGIEGGMSTGEPIVITSYLKPISTTLTPIKSVDLANKVETETVYERSDTCAVPRAVPIFESVVAVDLLNALLEKIGGDSKEEIEPRVVSLRKINVDDFYMQNKKWKMLYESE